MQIPEQRSMGARGRTGAASELLVAADLLRRGVHVFRAEAAHCPCDLIAMYPDGKLLRVEVRTGVYYPPTDTVQIPFKGSERFDLLAIVVDGRVGYIGPDAPEPCPWRLPAVQAAKVANALS